MNEPAKLAVLVSGGGTNLQALLDAQEKGTLKSGRITLVVSNNPDAYALKRAALAGVKTAVVTRKAFGEGFEREISRVLRSDGVELVILAGFMAILGRGFTDEWRDRIINVHPSLIPSFCGKGYYGLKVHEEALKKGVKVTGATVHFVNEVPDGGKIIMQKAVKVLDGDTPERLQKRVMRQAEWKILPAAAELISERILKSRGE